MSLQSTPSIQIPFPKKLDQSLARKILSSIEKDPFSPEIVSQIQNLLFNLSRNEAIPLQNNLVDSMLKGIAGAKSWPSDHKTIFYPLAAFAALTIRFNKDSLQRLLTENIKSKILNLDNETLTDLSIMLRNSIDVGQSAELMAIMENLTKVCVLLWNKIYPSLIENYSQLLPKDILSASLTFSTIAHFLKLQGSERLIPQLSEFVNFYNIIISKGTQNDNISVRMALLILHTKLTTMITMNPSGFNIQPYTIIENLINLLKDIPPSISSFSLEIISMIRAMMRKKEFGLQKEDVVEKLFLFFANFKNYPLECFPYVNSLLLGTTTINIRLPTNNALYAVYVASLLNANISKFDKYQPFKILAPLLKITDEMQEISSLLRFSFSLNIKHMIRELDNINLAPKTLKEANSIVRNLFYLGKLDPFLDSLFFGLKYSNSILPEKFLNNNIIITYLNKSLQDTNYLVDISVHILLFFKKYDYVFEKIKYIWKENLIPEEDQKYQRQNQIYTQVNINNYIESIKKQESLTRKNFFDFLISLQNVFIVTFWDQYLTTIFSSDDLEFDINIGMALLETKPLMNTYIVSVLPVVLNFVKNGKNICNVLKYFNSVVKLVFDKPEFYEEFDQMKLIQLSIFLNNNLQLQIYYEDVIGSLLWIFKLLFLRKIDVQNFLVESCISMMLNPAIMYNKFGENVISLIEFLANNYPPCITYRAFIESIIKCLSINPEKAYPILGKIRKTNIDILSRDEFAQPLGNAIIKNFDSLEGNTKNIALKVLRDIFIDKTEAHFPDSVFQNSVIKFINNDVIAHINTKSLIESLVKSITESPGNKVSYDTLIETIDLYFGDSKWTNNKRLELLQILYGVFQVHEKEPEMVEYFFKQVLGKFPTNTVIKASLFIAACQFDKIEEYVLTSIISPLTKEESVLLMKEITLIISLNFIGSIVVFKNIVNSIVDNTRIEVTDPIIFAYLIYAISKSFTGDTKNYGQYDAFLDELNIFPYWFVKAVHFCKECVQYDPSLIPEILNQISGQPYILVIIFGEMISGFKVDVEMNNIIQCLVTKCKNDPSVTNVHVLEIIFRVFPSIIEDYKSDLIELIKEVQAIGNMDILFALLVPLFSNGIFDVPIKLQDIILNLKSRIENKKSNVQSHMLLHSLYKHNKCPEYFESVKNNLRAVVKGYCDKRMLITLKKFQVVYESVFPEVFVSMFKEMLLKNSNDPGISQEDFTIFVETVIKSLSYTSMYKMIEKEGLEIEFYRIILNIFSSNPLLHKTANASKLLCSFLNKNHEKFVEYIVNEGQASDFEVISLEIENQVMCNIRFDLSIKKAFFMKELALSDGGTLTNKQQYIAKIAATIYDDDDEIDAALFHICEHTLTKTTERVHNCNGITLMTILDHFTKHNLTKFLDLSMIALQSNIPLFIEAVEEVFNSALKRSRFPCNEFICYNKISECPKVFIQTLGLLFTKKHPNLVNKFLRKIKETTPIMTYASILLVFADNNVEFDKSSIDTVELYDNSTNDEEKLACASLWMRIPAEHDFERMFKNLIDYVNIITPSDIDEAIKDIKIPETADKNAVSDILLSKIKEFKAQNRIILTALQIISTNIHFFSPVMNKFLPFLKDVSCSLSLFLSISQCIRYTKFISPFVNILCEDTQIDARERACMIYHIYEFIIPFFNIISKNPTQVKTFSIDIFHSIEFMFKNFNVPIDLFKLIFNFIQGYYLKTTQQSNALFYLFEIYHSVCTKIIQYTLIPNRYPNFQPPPNMLDIYVSIAISEHQRPVCWINAIFVLQTLACIPNAANKIAEVWEKLNKEQAKKIFLVLWPSVTSHVFRNGKLTSFFISTIQSPGWNASAVDYFIVSNMLSVMLIKPAEDTYKVLLSTLDNAIENIGLEPYDSIAFMFATQMIGGETSNAFLKKAIIERLENESFAKLFFSKTNETTLKILMNDKELKHIIINYFPSLFFAEGKKPEIYIPKILASNFLSLILNAKAKDCFAFVKHLPQSDINAICYQATKLKSAEFNAIHYAEIKNGIESISKELTEWQTDDFSLSNDDYKDSASPVLQSARLAIRHGYSDIALNMIVNNERILPEINEYVQKEKSDPIIKKALELFADQPSYISINDPSKQMMKSIATTVTSETIQEYLVVREIRRFLKITQNEPDFQFDFQLSPAVAPIIHSDYDTIRKCLIELAPRVSSMNGVSRSDVILEQKLEKSQIAHFSSEAIYKDATSSSNKKLITFLLSKNLDETERGLLFKLTKKVVEQDGESSSAFIALKYLIKFLSPEEIKEIAVKPLSYKWSPVFIEETEKRPELRTYEMMKLFDPAYELQMFINGFEMSNESSKSCKIISMAIDRLIDSPQYKRIKERYLNKKCSNEYEELSLFVDQIPLSKSNAPLSNISDRRTSFISATIDSQDANFMRVVFILDNSRQEVNYILTPYEVATPSTQAFTHEVSRILQTSPGSYQREIKLQSHASIKVKENAYLTITNASPADLYLNDAKETVSVFTCKKEYFEWSTRFSTRLAALTFVSHIREKGPINIGTSIFDTENAMLSVPDYKHVNDEEKFVLDNRILNIMNKAQLYGPFRAGLIATADATMLKIARFRALGISLFEDDNEFSAKIEENTKSLSLRANISDSSEMQNKINELISSVSSQKYE